MTEAPTPPAEAPVHNTDLPGATPNRPLTAIERRALEEAAARQAATRAAETSGEEVGGPRGPEPTRYGDWERKGLAVDF
ncbi:DUF1674 domain-containing protein [Brevundimonas sp.]|uniref:DUF1674 domain-containing protein n=1 Tax=Brevundimonas sp. TaxID=1871086 RepID=UPI001DD37359|nr:DUF1674 domain-containing protein [Brevundimonas sp.]MBL0948017.1 DUF1674 domain-containing protein [Brevundimonas sp.]